MITIMVISHLFNCRIGPLNQFVHEPLLFLLFSFCVCYAMAHIAWYILLHLTPFPFYFTFQQAYLWICTLLVVHITIYNCVEQSYYIYMCLFPLFQITSSSQYDYYDWHYCYYYYCNTAARDCESNKYNTIGTFAFHLFLRNKQFPIVICFQFYVILI